LSGIEAIVERVRGSPMAMANVARTLLLTKGDAERARALCDEALSMAPDNSEIMEIRAAVYSSDVGRWYFSNMRDEPRHDAYDRAFRRALAGGGRVLEIGAGTGLFAMMAARAGADEVISCERQPAVARGARSVVARNGQEKKITVLAKASSDLEVGVDMVGRADVLVWDNLANNLVGAGALPVIEDAMRRLVKPGGQVIPARGAIMAALAEDSDLGSHRLGQVAGFDLSPFNALAQPVYTVKTTAPELAIRSSAAVLFEFDFRTGGPFPAARTERTVVGSGGQANGVVQWLHFDLDDDEIYQPAPGVRARAFGLEFRPLAEPYEAVEGASFTIQASHDRERLSIWLGDR
jgi:protein-L-isoaspartate O-methyltransferase